MRFAHQHRRHGQHRSGHGPSAFDVQTIANADGCGDENAEQPGGAQAGAIRVVRRDQVGLRETRRGRAQGTVGGRRGRPPAGRVVVVARARRHRSAVSQFRLVGHRGRGRRPRRPGRLPGGAVVQAPAVSPATVVRREGAGRRSMCALRLPGGIVQNEPVVVRRREPEVRARSHRSLSNATTSPNPSDSSGTRYTPPPLLSPPRVQEIDFLFLASYKYRIVTPKEKKNEKQKFNLKKKKNDSIAKTR